MQDFSTRECGVQHHIWGHEELKRTVLGLWEQFLHQGLDPVGIMAVAKKLLK